MKRFNVTGLCVPEEDYMADISGKIEKIKELVDNRSYFTINRARQYGKTTILAALERALKDEYISSDFRVHMSFNPEEISAMLAEYEKDHQTGMDIAAIAEEIYSYTSGYPFLVSKICKCIDEKVIPAEGTPRGGEHKDWTTEGVQKAVKMLLDESNALFDDISKNLENNKELADFIYELLVLGEVKSYNIYNPVVSIGDRDGFLKKANDRDRVAVSNNIFELKMIDYFIASDLCIKKQVTDILQYRIVKDGRFDMELCLRMFAEHYAELFSAKDTEFLEKHGRLLFLSYLREKLRPQFFSVPVINGQGFYYIESQFTDLRRMDIVVDYGREHFIIELKLWHGEKYKEEAYSQLCGYLDSKGASTGYLLTFDFRKGVSKERKAEWLEIYNKRIFDIVV